MAPIGTNKNIHLVFSEFYWYCSVINIPKIHSVGSVALSSQRMSVVATIRKFYEDVQRQRRAGSGADVEFDTASIPGESGPKKKSFQIPSFVPRPQSSDFSQAGAAAFYCTVYKVSNTKLGSGDWERGYVCEQNQVKDCGCLTGQPIGWLSCVAPPPQA